MIPEEVAKIRQERIKQEKTKVSFVKLLSQPVY